MVTSVFFQIFPYRQRCQISPIENYLTEILSFCLENDVIFRQDLFTFVLDIPINNQEFEIKTQNEYEGYGRPDIEINFEETTVLIECKIEAFERANQLEDYAAILIDKKPGKTSKHIVFLTKYFESKELCNKTIILHHVRWFEVFSIINEKHNLITNQFKQFLKEQNMETIKNFTLQDMIALKTIPSAISKMNELLEQFKPEFEKQFGGYSKDSSRSSRLKDSLYINYITLNYKKAEYWLLIGFFWWWGEEFEIPYVGISLEVPIKKFTDNGLITILDKELNCKEWEIEEEENTVYYSAIKPITDFITQQEDNIPAMKKFISENLQTLYKLRDKYPDIFRK